MKNTLIISILLLLTSCGKKNSAAGDSGPLFIPIMQKEEVKEVPLKLTSSSTMLSTSFRVHRDALKRIAGNFLLGRKLSSENELLKLIDSYDLGVIGKKDSLELTFTRELKDEDNLSILVSTEEQEYPFMYQDEIKSLGDKKFSIDLSRIEDKSARIRIKSDTFKERANLFISTNENDYSFLVPEGESFETWLKENSDLLPNSINVILNKDLRFNEAVNLSGDIFWSSNFYNAKEVVKAQKKYWLLIGPKVDFYSSKRAVREKSSLHDFSEVMCPGEKLKLKLFGYEEVSKFKEWNEYTRGGCFDETCHDNSTYYSYFRVFDGEEKIELKEEGLKNYVKIIAGIKEYDYVKSFQISGKECMKVSLKIMNQKPTRSIKINKYMEEKRSGITRVQYPVKNPSLFFTDEEVVIDGSFEIK